MALIESLEHRALMSATLTAGDAPTEVALLLPTVQAAREASPPAKTKPIIDVVYSQAGNSADYYPRLQLVLI